MGMLDRDSRFPRDSRVAFAPETLHFVHEPERDVNQNIRIFKPLFANGLIRNAKYSLRVRIIEEILSALRYDAPRESGKGRGGIRRISKSWNDTEAG
jgi:hypothetical protein